MNTLPQQSILFCGSLYSRDVSGHPMVRGQSPSALWLTEVVKADAKETLASEVLDLSGTQMECEREVDTVIG